MTRFKTPFILICLLTLLAILSPVNAANPVTAETGDTWIKYSWSGNGSYIIYQDGMMVANGSTLDYYLISDLPPDERHILEVRDAETGAPIGTATASTLPAPHTMIFLLLIQLFLMYLVFVAKDVSFGMLTGCASFVLGSYVLLTGASQFWAVLISLILLILTGLATIRLMYESYTNSKRWL